MIFSKINQLLIQPGDGSSAKYLKKSFRITKTEDQWITYQNPNIDKGSSMEKWIVDQNMLKLSETWRWRAHVQIGYFNKESHAYHA